MSKGSSRQFQSTVAPWERPSTSDRPQQRSSRPCEPQHSSRVVVASPSYIVFVKKLKFGPKAFWSLPGGRREPGESSALQTAYRETAEEIRLRLGKRHALCIWEAARSSPRAIEDLVLFWLSDELIQTVPTEGDENGDPLAVKLFRRDELANVSNFNANHVELLTTALEHLEREGL